MYRHNVTCSSWLFTRKFCTSRLNTIAHALRVIRGKFNWVAARITSWLPIPCTVYWYLLMHWTNAEMDEIHSKQDYCFRKMSVDVARRLTEDDVRVMSYLYDVHIPATLTNTLPMVLHIFTHLKKEGHLSSDKTGVAFLIRMLNELPRRDIARDCEQFLQRSGPSPGLPHTHSSWESWLVPVGLACMVLHTSCFHTSRCTKDTHENHSTKKAVSIFSTVCISALYVHVHYDQFSQFTVYNE